MKDLMVVGHFGKWLVVIDENDNLYVRKEENHIYEPGTICDSDLMFVSLNLLDETEQNKLMELLSEEVA